MTWDEIPSVDDLRKTESRRWATLVNNRILQAQQERKFGVCLDLREMSYEDFSNMKDALRHKGYAVVLQLDMDGEPTGDRHIYVSWEL